MNPTVTRFPDATEFLTAAGPFLMEQEALNGLMLGAAKAPQRPPPRRRRPPIYALTSNDGRPVAAAMMNNGRKLLLTGGVESMSALAHHLVATNPDLPSVLGPSEPAQQFSKVWSEMTDRLSQPGMCQRLNELTEVTLPINLPDGRLRPATTDERDFLARWLLAFQQEAVPDEAGDLDAAQFIIDLLVSKGNLFVWQKEDGWVVSMAARARPTAHGVALNLVYTPPEMRRHGFAAASVAHLSRQLLAEGYTFCTLFTDRANATSNRLYERIGYRPIADFDEYRFQPD